MTPQTSSTQTPSAQTPVATVTDPGPATAAQRRTKIIWSFPAHALDNELAERAAKEDVDGLRIVFQREHVTDIVRFVRRYQRQKQERRAPLMLDISSWTQGFLTGGEESEVAFGDHVCLWKQDAKRTKGDEAHSWVLNTSYWGSVFSSTSTVYFGFGSVVLKVREQHDDRVILEAVQGGFITEGMDVYVPDTRTSPSIRHVKSEELEAFKGCTVDHLVVPGQWSKEELSNIRKKLIERFGEHAPWLLAKVDSHGVFESLSDKLEHVEGVLISRRELALTCNPASVPMMTKEIIQLCNDRAKIVVTASEMLASMRHNATPTRAEVSDIANAAMDGTDAVILSEEVASNRHGPKAIQVMRSIIADIEQQNVSTLNWIKEAPPVENEMDAISINAYRTAERIGAKAIVCITKAGNTATRLSSFRVPVPVIAVTFSEQIRDKLSIVGGVEVLKFDMEPKIDDVLPTVMDQLLERSWLQKGDEIIFVAVSISPIGEEASNLFTIQRLE